MKEGANELLGRYMIKENKEVWEKARLGWSETTALKHAYYQVWNRLPVQVGCMRHVLRAGALGWPGGMGCGGRWEGGSGWETHINPWLIHVNVWQKPLQYCKVISLQLINENLKKERERERKQRGRFPDTYLQILVSGNKAQRIRPRKKEWAGRMSVTVF